MKDYIKARVRISTSGCWVWQRAVHKKRGYGVLCVGGRTQRAHRASYEAFVGPVPAGMLVRHKCDCRRCCSPDHLELGTPAQNSRDMVERGHVQRGEATHCAVLTDEIVRSIRREYAKGNLSQREVADMFGTDQGSVSRIVNKKIWPHVE